MKISKWFSLSAFFAGLAFSVVFNFFWKFFPLQLDLHLNKDITMLFLVLIVFLIYYRRVIKKTNNKENCN